MILALSIVFLFAIVLVFGLTDLNGSAPRIDHAGIALLKWEHTDRLNREAQAKREADAKAHAAMFPKPAPVLSETALRSFHAATSEQRGAYYGALIRRDVTAANAAASVLGLPSEYVAHEMESDHVNGLRQQLAEQRKAEEKERYEKLMATRNMTPAQATFAASMELPPSKRNTGSVPSEDPSLTPNQRLAMRGAMTKGQAAFAETLELPKS